MEENETTNPVKKCIFCSQIHEGRCPIVKSIEYYPNGTIKKVEYVMGDKIEIPEIVNL